MAIVEATEVDIPQLHAIIELCYRGEESKNGWTTETNFLGGIRSTEEIVKREMEIRGGKFLKYTDADGKINGCVYVLLTPEAAKVYIGFLCVNPHMQTKGIGKDLMAAAEHLAIRSGCTNSSLTVIARRKELVAWYVRQGYKSNGELTPFADGGGVGDAKDDIPIELLTMTKSLK